MISISIIFSKTSELQFAIVKVLLLEGGKIEEKTKR
jgi:hypothetical protein